MGSPNALPLHPALTRWQAYDYERTPRLPARWLAEIGRDQHLRHVVMVVDLALSGPLTRTIRCATVPVQSVSRDGTRHDALPLLIEEPSIGQTYTLGSGTSEARSITLTVSMLRVDVMALLRGGGALVGIAEVALESTAGVNDYDTRYVLLRGDVSGSTFGARRAHSNNAGILHDEAELVTLEISDPRETVATMVPPFTIDDSRWANVHESAVGERYPVVVNEAYRCPCPRLTNNAVGAQEFAAALRFGHYINPAGSATVFVNGVGVAQADATYGWTTAETLDAQDTQITTVQFTNAATAWADNDAVHVTTEQDADDSLWLTPIECLWYVLTEFSPLGHQGVSPELFGTASARWPNVGKPRICINSAGPVLDWCEAGFLASFPMLSMVWEAGKYGPVLTDRRLQPTASWVVGAAPLLDRASAVQCSRKGDLFNEFQLRYRYNPLTDVYRSTLSRGAATSAVCEHSRSLVGQRDCPVISSIYISDASTAAYVLDWLVDHLALPSYLVEYDAMPWVMLRYRRGDTIQLTDPAFGWVAEQATIEGMTYRRGHVVVALRVWLRCPSVGGQGLSRPVTT